MTAKLLIGLAAVALGTAAIAEVVEEETWYNAQGQVVKKVKRTLTGAEARTSPDWEPAWVVRERQRGGRRVRYSSSHWRGSDYGYGYGYGYGGGVYYSGYRGYCSPRAYRRSGFTGYYRGGSRWGVSYRSPGLHLHYRR